MIPQTEAAAGYGGPQALRRLHFDRLFNARDLGGLPIRGDRLIQPGRIIRSDDPHLTTPVDREQLRSLSIDSVIDLRTEGEVQTRGTDAWTELGVHRIATPWWKHVPPFEEQHRYLRPDSTADLYAEMHRSSLKNQRAAWLALTTALEGRTVIHCASGRDRTGIMMAILLSALGAPRQDILDDYSYSSIGMTEMLDHLESTATPEELEKLNLDRDAAIRTPGETIDRFLDWLIGEHGSIEGYFKDLDCPHVANELRDSLLAA